MSFLVDVCVVGIFLVPFVRIYCSGKVCLCECMCVEHHHHSSDNTAKVQEYKMEVEGGDVGGKSPASHLSRWETGVWQGEPE